MKRRLLAGGIACLFLHLLGCVSEKEDTGMPNPLQNIVVILADDHALKVTGAYGNSMIRTPNIDRLTREGVTFNRAYCNAPICSASRASLLTGKYPHATGVNLLFTPFPDEGNITIAEHLQTLGYSTGLMGKTHFNNWAWSHLYEDGLPKHGFDTLIERSAYRKFLQQKVRRPIPTTTPVYEAGGDRQKVAQWMNADYLPQAIWDEDSEGTFYAQQAIQFLRDHQSDPFLLWLAFKEPHHPYYFPLEFANKYDPASLLLPIGSPEDDRWVPQKFKGLTATEKAGIIASYYSSTEYLDKNIGLVLDALDELKLAENTLVVYLSDNGYLLYEHKRFEKHTMWEESIKQPLIIRHPKVGKGGERRDALVEYVDIVPSLLELIGAEPLTAVQGESFVPVLAGQSTAHRSFAFSQYLEDNLAMVCTDKWKYMFTTGSRDLGIGYQTGLGPSGIVHRLYDLESDPQEYRNVAKEVENQSILLDLQEKMLARFMKTHPDAASCPQGLSLEGKLVWFCEPRDVGVDQSLEDKPVRVFNSSID